MEGLPMEIIAKILGVLGSDWESLWAASGVSVGWWEVINGHVLAPLGGLILRPPLTPTTPAHYSRSFTQLHIVNLTDLAPILPVLSSNVTEVYIGFDTNPGILECGCLAAILNICNNLKRLVINNSYLTASHIHTILQCLPPTLEALRIFLQKQEDIETAGVRLLNDNKEIFREAIIEWKYPVHTLYGIYPNELEETNSEKWSSNVSTLSLECGGLPVSSLSNICFMDHLQELELLDVSKLNASVLISVSKLPLVKLILTGVQKVSMVDWVTAFGGGFSILQSLTLKDCNNLSDDGIRSLPTNLKYLMLDLRQNMNITTLGYFALYSLCKLETLDLFLVNDKYALNIIRGGVLTHWKNLSALTINVHPNLDNSLSISDFENNAKCDLLRCCKLKLISIQYYCVLTNYISTINAPYGMIK